MPYTGGSILSYEYTAGGELLFNVTPITGTMWGYSFDRITVNLYDDANYMNLIRGNSIDATSGVTQVSAGYPTTLSSSQTVYITIEADARRQTGGSGPNPSALVYEGSMTINNYTTWVNAPYTITILDASYSMVTYQNRPTQNVIYDDLALNAVMYVLRVSFTTAQQDISGVVLKEIAPWLNSPRSWTLNSIVKSGSTYSISVCMKNPCLQVSLMPVKSDGTYGTETSAANVRISTTSATFYDDNATPYPYIQDVSWNSTSIIVQGTFSTAGGIRTPATLLALKLAAEDTLAYGATLTVSGNTFSAEFSTTNRAFLTRRNLSLVAQTSGGASFYTTSLTTIQNIKYQSLAINGSNVTVTLEPDYYPGLRPTHYVIDGTTQVPALGPTLTFAKGTVWYHTIAPMRQRVDGLATSGLSINVETGAPAPVARSDIVINKSGSGLSFFMPGMPAFATGGTLQYKIYSTSGNLLTAAQYTSYNEEGGDSGTELGFYSRNLFLSVSPIPVSVRITSTGRYGENTGAIIPLPSTSATLDTTYVSAVLTSGASASDMKAQIRSSLSTATVPVFTAPSLDISTLITNTTVPLSTFVDKPVTIIVPKAGTTVTLDVAAQPNGSILYLATNPGESVSLSIEGVTYTCITGASDVTINGTTYAVGDPILFGTVEYVFAGTGSAAFTKGSAAAICFMPSTPILTPGGYRRIDSLRVGDLVVTGDGRSVPVQRVVCNPVMASPFVNPYTIPRGRFGAEKRIQVSPKHRIQVEGRGMVEARELGLQQEEKAGRFVYYNLELPNWNTDTVVAGGVVCESLAPVRRISISPAAFKNLLVNKYGAAALSSENVQRMLRACRVMPDGSIEAPVMSRRA